MRRQHRKGTVYNINLFLYTVFVGKMTTPTDNQPELETRHLTEEEIYNQLVIQEGDNEITAYDKSEPFAKLDESRDPAFRNLVQKIGGREGLSVALRAMDSPKAAKLLEYLTDPSFDRASVKTLCRKCGITYVELVNLYRDSRVQDAMISGLKNLPDIVESASELAIGYFADCPTCNGYGTVIRKNRKTKEDEEFTCRTCKGNGVIRTGADKDARKFIGEMAGLVKAGGVNVQVNTQVNNSQPVVLSSFEELMKKASGVGLSKQPIEVIDAEVNEE